MLKQCAYLVIVIVLVLIPGPLRAELRIHEVYPAPSTGEDEWVELYNDSGEVIQLGSYTVTDEKGTLLHLAPVSISPSGTTLATSKNILNNSGDTVYLIKDGNTVDKVVYDQSMDSSIAYGYCPGMEPLWKTIPPTKDSPNDSACNMTVAISPSVSQTIAATPIPAGILSTLTISEVVPNPETNDYEWVELYNNSDVSFTADLVVEDGNTSGKPVVARVLMEKRGYAVVEIPTYIFNNEGDVVRIRIHTGEIISSITYPTIEKGFSWGRQENGLYCMVKPSKGSANSSCIIAISPEPSPTKTPSPSRTPTQLPSPTIVAQSMVPSATIRPRRTIPTARIYQTIPTLATAAGSVQGVTAAADTLQHNARIPLLLLIIAACMAVVAGVAIALRIRNRITGY